MKAIALDLDGVLGDTRPLWRAWLEDAARRFRMQELDGLPADRVAAAAGRARAAYHRTVSRSRTLSLWLPVLVWAGLIFGLSSIPSLGTGLGAWDLALRKLAHASEYAVLGLLLLRALGREWAAVAVGVLYAATDELHQHFVSGRHASPVDVAIDAAGVLAGVFLVRRALTAR